MSKEAYRDGLGKLWRDNFSLFEQLKGSREQEQVITKRKKNQRLSFSSELIMNFVASFSHMVAIETGRQQKAKLLNSTKTDTPLRLADRRDASSMISQQYRSYFYLLVNLISLMTTTFVPLFLVKILDDE